MKKGQVTIYIIVGVIILLVAVGFFVIRGIITEEKITSVERVIEEVPAEFIPVRTFTESCLESVATQALILLGQQGGHMRPSAWSGLRFDPAFHTDSDGLLIPADDPEGLQVPYWWYNRIENERNEIGFSTNKPTIRDMEIDLARFIEDEIDNCLVRYGAMEEQGFLVEESEDLAAASQILPGSVRFSLNHPLTAKKGGASARISQFFVEIPVDLLRLYNLAEKIMQEQQNQSFLEHHTLNIIEFASDTTPDALPPMTDSSFELVNANFWSEAQVREDLRTVVASHMPLLRYAGSSNFVELGFPFGTQERGVKQGVLDATILPLSGAEDVAVSFTYLPDWELFLALNNEGDTLQPQSLSIFFDWFNFGLQRFKTVYDVSYPVFVSLSDTSSLSGQGFTFNFALESNVRNNDFPEPGKLPDQVSNFDEELVCDLDKRNSGLIRVNARDAHTKSALEGASVFYTLGDASCAMGTTGDDGVLALNFPIGVGGVVTITHPDYLAVSEFLDTELRKDDSLDVEMWRFKTVELQAVKRKVFNCKSLPEFIHFVGVKEGKTRCYLEESFRVNASQPAHPFDEQIADLFSSGTQEGDSFIAKYDVEGSLRAFKSSWFYSPPLFALSDNEVGFYTLRRETQKDQSHTAAIQILGTSPRLVRMVPGEYKAQASVLLGSGVDIPADQRCDYNELVGQRLFCSDLDEVELEEFPSGGVEGLIVNIDPDLFYAASRISLPVLTLALDDVDEESRVIEDMQILEEIGAMSQRFSDQLQPLYE